MNTAAAGIHVAARRGRSITAPRLTLAGLSFASTLAALVLLAGAFSPGGVSPLEIVLLVLYAILFLWICLSFWTAAIGFLRLLVRRSRPRAGPPPRGRTAIVMPVYNESPVRVFAGLRAMWACLAASDSSGIFDLHILSDTRDPDLWVQEETAWARMCHECGGAGRIFYRNRPHNTGRKAGNITEFVTRCGGAYEFMIILDADSIMDAATMIEMVRRMEANPRLGLLQVPPVPVNHDSLFARMLQFAGQLYGRMFVAGLDFWQGGEGNYWGHNAIARVAAFAACCGLPRLPGREPLGGEILSHDFVEAALLVRAGWEVRVAADLDGSYEEVPATLIDYAKRDRRWCQGNLQHAGLLFARAWHPVSRVHFALGVMSYLASPLWLLFLLLAGVDARVQASEVPVYFFGENLFPSWPESYAFEMTTVLAVTLAMLFLPKAMVLGLLALDPPRRRAFGGLVRATASALAESVLATLLAPVLMLFQSKFVAAILMHRAVGWPPQRRGDHATGALEALGAHGGQTLAGVAAGLGTWLYVPGFFWWFTPVLAGLLLAIPLSMATSRAAFGRAARALGLFLTPGELDRPAVLRRLDEEIARLDAPAPAIPHWWQAVADPAVHALHLSLLPPTIPDRRRQHHLDGLVLRLLEDGPHALDATARRDLISARRPLADLHALVWAWSDGDPPPPGAV